jgi:hypothetical protein
MEAFQWSIIVILIAVLIGQMNQTRDLWERLLDLEDLFERRDEL